MARNTVRGVRRPGNVGKYRKQQQSEHCKQGAIKGVRETIETQHNDLYYNGLGEGVSSCNSVVQQELHDTLNKRYSLRGGTHYHAWP